MYFTTEDVNRLSVPFGIILGPCTVVYHLTNLVLDIAKIAYYSFLNRNYQPSEGYHLFRLADLQWEMQVSRWYRPSFNQDGTINQRTDLLYDRVGKKLIVDALNYPLVSCALTSVYKDLSQADRREIELENAKRDFFQQVFLIAVGVIRTIPVVGAATLCYFDAVKI